MEQVSNIPRENKYQFETTFRIYLLLNLESEFIPNKF